MSQEIATRPTGQLVANKGMFHAVDLKDAMEIATLLSSSTMVPEAYQGEKGRANCIVAMDMSERVGASVFAVMQNMHVIKGRPSWSSQFIIASINTCGRFSPLQYKITRAKKAQEVVRRWKYGSSPEQSEKMNLMNHSCMAFAKNLDTGEVLEGPVVDLRMAFLEGWWTKPGSKWPTMTDLMLTYRASAFFGRLYCPEILMGMQTDNEVLDIVYDADAIAVDVQATTEPVSAGTDIDDLNAELFETEANNGSGESATNNG